MSVSWQPFANCISDSEWGKGGRLTPDGCRLKSAEKAAGDRHVGPGSDVVVQELCESRGGRLGLTSLMVSVDVKQYRTRLTHWSQLVPNMSTDIRGH